MKPPAFVLPATRLRYLHLAAELATRPGMGQPTYPYAVSSVTMADTAAALGVHRSALYRLWPSKFDFWDSLIAYLAERDLEPRRQTSATALIGNATDLADGLRRIRQPLIEVQAAMRDDPWSALRTALLGYPDSPRATELVTATTEHAIDNVIRQGEQVHQQLGVEAVPPLSTADIATFSYCIVDGLGSAARLTPSIDVPDIVLDDRPDEPWGLFGYAVRCLCQRFTLPATDRVTVHPSPPPPDVARSRTWTPAQQAALAAGADLFRAEVLRLRDAQDGTSAGGPLGQVTIARVARHANVSRQAIHLIWPNQQALRNDLMRHLYRQEHAEVVALLRQALHDGVNRPSEVWLAAVDRVLTRHIELARTSSHSYLAYATLYHSPEIAEIARTEIEGALRQAADDLDAVIADLGYRVRPGITTYHLAALILLSGPAIGRLHRSNPDVRQPKLPYKGGKWSAMSVLMDGIIAESLEPAT